MRPYGPPHVGREAVLLQRARRRRWGVFVLRLQRVSARPFEGPWGVAGIRRVPHAGGG